MFFDDPNPGLADQMRPHVVQNTVVLPCLLRRSDAGGCFQQLWIARRNRPTRHMDRTLEYDGAVAGAGRGFNSSGAESDGSAESEIDIDDAHARVHAEEAVVMEDPPLMGVRPVVREGGGFELCYTMQAIWELAQLGDNYDTERNKLQSVISALNKRCPTPPSLPPPSSP